MRAVVALGFTLLATAVTAQDDPRDRLVVAKTQASVAAARATRLERAAAGEANAARRAKADEAALAARIEATQADVAAARARAAIVGELIVAQRARLAAGQGPIARLVGALQSLTARPTVAAIVQPGSVDDLVHVRAVLGAAIPVVRARTAGVRTELDRSRALQANATLAARTLADGRARLETQRLALVQLEARHRLRGQGLGRDALFESDRALALGERARDIVGALDLAQDSAAIEARLVMLPGPLPRPDGTASPTASTPAYRLPVAGRIVTGLGEIADSGVRSRGLTLAAASAVRVIAPAAGRIAFVGQFRDYGRVVVIDHGDGWTSALTGLGETEVATGDRVRAGDAIGRAGVADATGAPARVTVELRRRGRAVDMTPLIG